MASSGAPARYHNQGVELQPQNGSYFGSINTESASKFVANSTFAAASALGGRWADQCPAPWVLDLDNYSPNPGTPNHFKLDRVSETANAPSETPNAPSIIMVTQTPSSTAREAQPYAVKGTGKPAAERIAAKKAAAKKTAAEKEAAKKAAAKKLGAKKPARSTPRFERRDMPENRKGKGLVALVDVAKGDTVLEERPLLLLPEDFIYLSDDDYNSLFMSKLRLLSAAEQKEVIEFQMWFTKEFGDPTLLQIWHGHGVLDAQRTQYGIFPNLPWMKQECDPNSEWEWDLRKGRKVVVRVKRDIAAGEQLTIAPFPDACMLRRDSLWERCGWFR